MQNLTEAYELNDLMHGCYEIGSDVWFVLHAYKKPEELKDENYTIISIVDDEIRINNLSLQYQLFVMDNL